MTDTRDLSTGTADLEVDCAIPGEEPQASINHVTVTAPAAVAAGDEAELQVTLLSKAATPRDLAALEVTAELRLRVDGAGGDKVLLVTGLTNAEAIPRGGNVFLASGTTRFTPQEAGTYTFTPGDHVVVTSDHPVECTVTGGSRVAARTEVQ